MGYGELDKRHITSYVSFEKGTLANEDINEGTVEPNLSKPGWRKAGKNYF